MALNKVIRSKLSTLWHQLTAPLPAVKDPERRLLSQWFAALFVSPPTVGPNHDRYATFPQN